MNFACLDQIWAILVGRQAVYPRLFFPKKLTEEAINDFRLAPGLPFSKREYDADKKKIVPLS